MMSGEVSSLPRAEVDVGAEAKLVQDRVMLLYSHARGGVVASAMAGVILATLAWDKADSDKLVTWAVAIAIVLALRTTDILLWSRRPRNVAGRRDLLRFGIGAVSTAVLWGLFPVLFFPGLPPLTRTYCAVVFAALAGGSAPVLAVSLPIAIAYCTMLLLPVAIVAMVLPGGKGPILLGLLSLVGLAFYIWSNLVANRSAVGALRLLRRNEALMRQVGQAREEALALNVSLSAARSVLAEANQGLEGRIAQRTAALQAEVADRERVGRLLEQLASTDPLTGLSNRTALARRLGGVLAAAECAGAGVSVLFLDLDGFKRINDARGHAAGDLVLRAVADRLRRTVDPSYVLARWGGDEFVIIAEQGVGAPDAAGLAAVVLRCFAEPFGHAEQALHVSATIGVASYPQHGRTQDALILAADVAMFAGKQDGGNLVRLFAPALAETVASAHGIEQGLRRALDQGGLSLAYQPIVNADGRCTAMEALMRWTDEQRGPVSPAEFIPVAERSGLIGRLGEWALHRACRDAALWPGHPAPVVSVNVSIWQVMSGQLPGQVRAALAQSGLPAARLQLELTESLVGRGGQAGLAGLDELRKIGVRITLDDFGTGFSSLSRLRSWPLDAVKVDRSFVQAMATEGTTLVQATLLIAASYGLGVTAEGVETQSQRDTLLALGVTSFQGYLFARPMPAETVDAWLGMQAHGGPVTAPESGNADTPLAVAAQ